MQVRIEIVKWIQMKKIAIQRLARCEKEGLCLACLKPIGSSRVVRGCHEKCARATYRAIGIGAFTDEERVANGKWLAKAKTGPKPSNPVSIEAEEGVKS